MFCSKCGSNLPPGSAFCQVCGTALAVSAVPAGTLPPGSAPAGLAPVAVAAAPGAVSPHWLPPSTRVYAGFWLRFVAHLIDGLILGAVFFAMLVPVFFMTGLGAAIKSIDSTRPPDPVIVATLVSSVALLAGGSLLIGWLYNAYFESSEWQGTVGKKVMNLIVTDLEGNHVTFARASGRFFAKIISGLIPLGIGYIMAGFTERRQALHDMIASCLVLRS
jgi:uncharacterized RDD family membrane protein YckC